jgi:glucokinase
LAVTAPVMPRRRAALNRAVPFPPRLSAARFVDDAPLVGTVALALAAAR